MFHFETLQMFDYSDFIGPASTVHKSLQMVFLNYAFWCYPGYDRCLSVLWGLTTGELRRYSRNGIRSTNKRNFKLYNTKKHNFKILF